MKSIIKGNKRCFDEKIFSNAEKVYSITIRENIKTFIKTNGGGYPQKDIFTVDGDEYEIRVFLSADLNDENFCIEKPIKYFLDRTKGKVIPIGIDSGDNYYCVNNETGKVYFWSAGENQYYCISETLEKLVELFD